MKTRPPTHENKMGRQNTSDFEFSSLPCKQQLVEIWMFESTRTLLRLLQDKIYISALKAWELSG
jgi:hypothetical protein